MMLNILIAGVAAGLMAFAQTTRETQLEERVRVLEQRLIAVEAKLGGAPHEPAKSPLACASAQAAPTPEPAPQRDLTAASGIQVSGYFDGNYTYNANRPYNRIQLLRAYDVLHNNMNINQAGVVLERAVSAEPGRRFGMRLDLMYGQATETL